MGIEALVTQVVPRDTEFLKFIPIKVNASNQGSFRNSHDYLGQRKETTVLRLQSEG